MYHMTVYSKHAHEIFHDVAIYPVSRIATVTPDPDLSSLPYMAAPGSSGESGS